MFLFVMSDVDTTRDTYKQAKTNTPNRAGHEWASAYNTYVHRTFTQIIAHL